jgi:hypothetical protein
MLDLRACIPAADAPTHAVRGPRTRLELELRAMADDLVGRLDRDEVSRDDEERIGDAIEAAVLAALPTVMDALDRALTPRLEALPLNTRLTLARARRRRDYGLD